MADKEQIKQTAAMVLGCLEKVSSFASTINPLFGIVTSLIGVVREGLVEDGASELDKNFQQIHDKLESISVQNKQLLDQIQITEINKNYGDLEKNIKYQYQAFKTMVDRIRKDPEKDKRYREDFKKIYRKQKGRLNLNVFYQAVMEDQGPFGRPLLKFYLEKSNKNRKIMEARCAHLANLFHIGLMALMAYYVVTEDDEDEFREEWGQKVINIQTKMQEVLDECNSHQRLARQKTSDPSASMANKEQIKQTAAMVLGGLEKVSSFASSFNPLFGIVTTLVGLMRKGLVEGEASELDKDFQQIHDKLESIAKQNKQLLDQMQITEINKNYGDYEQNIKHQYQAFKTMVDQIRNDPEQDEHFKKDFKKTYEIQKGRLNLNVFYEAVIEEHGPFGRPLLRYYLEKCNRNRKIMEARCAHLIYLFHIGLIALMAYYIVTKDDQDAFTNEWKQRILDIQTKMQEVLDECSEPN
ncbi:uncharacterized protein LOC108256173 [Ictalurus punctatus]|uniref:Uncharacterized protein LOC108256173 n=1 Tax=Ictalurus punctatus TaxID=7998 RepID=A0A2D0PQH4_ICTPU|nr:uncharacterized protein LOC108256173 [Ictalurus punctatus]XP_053530814.1 uncharacterized protein LOC108256173 [Ictalurus punctatus]XP_053530815.1 uncharacterized protein LOC108256173 [Ictalurus punctatus]